MDARRAGGGMWTVEGALPRVGVSVPPEPVRDLGARTTTRGNREVLVKGRGRVGTAGLVTALGDKTGPTRIEGAHPNRRCLYDVPR